ncbi:MAG: thioredoxin-dependent thiol peroxidase [Spirochaetota bacterium]
MAPLKPGDQAPEFELADQNGNVVRLSGYRGRRLLVYFYPRADTPGCTRQACSVRDHRRDLKNLQVETVGISPDEPEKQKKFDDKYDLGFPLLADTVHQAAEAYGVWVEKTRNGRTYLGVNRSSFLIDEQGRVIQAWYGVSPEDTVPLARAALAGGDR